MVFGDLISKRTRNEFREMLVGWTLREIDIEFENEDFHPDLEYDPPLTGQRRSSVEQYYKNIDFRDFGQVRRLLRVFENIIDKVELHGPETAQQLRSCLERDGYKLEDGRFRPKPEIARLQSLRGIIDTLDVAEIANQIERIEGAIDIDPALAVGTSKELVESCCRTILRERSVNVSGRPDLPKLLKIVMKELKLLPDDIPDHAKGADIIKRLLSNLSTAVTGLAEIRNLYGTGHGRDGKVKGLSPRHAKLAAGAATTLATFLFETHRERP